MKYANQRISLSITVVRPSQGRDLLKRKTLILIECTVAFHLTCLSPLLSVWVGEPLYSLLYATIATMAVEFCCCFAVFCSVVAFVCYCCLLLCCFATIATTVSCFFIVCCFLLYLVHGITSDNFSKNEPFIEIPFHEVHADISGTRLITENVIDISFIL